MIAFTKRHFEDYRSSGTENQNSATVLQGVRYFVMREEHPTFLNNSRTFDETNSRKPMRGNRLQSDIPVNESANADKKSTAKKQRCRTVRSD